MNYRSFACRSCYELIDAGYRHCYWTLEAPGIIMRNLPVDVPAVLAADSYWRDADGVEFNASEEIKLFLLRHQDHDLIFVEDNDLPFCPMYEGDWRMFEWLDVSQCTPDLSPRYFFERLGLRTWKHVTEWVTSSNSFPWWWDEPTIMQAAESKFNSLVTEA